MEPLLCDRCDEPVETEGLCAKCEAEVEEARLEEMGEDARERLSKLHEAEELISEVNQPHPVACRCLICNASHALYMTIRAVERPGFDGPGKLVVPLEVRP